MDNRFSIGLMALSLGLAHQSFAASRLEKIRNAKVVVTEETLAPGERETAPQKLPSLIIFMTDGAETEGKDTQRVAKGQVESRPAGATPTKNDGSRPLHFIRIEFLTHGNDEKWGMAGLANTYKVLHEDPYARTYDIRIPAGAYEPQHTHHDRVVVCLSGAELEHILPDGTHQPSTLKTGEIAWRLGATHVGHNLGTTDLWVIAVEPK